MMELKQSFDNDNFIFRALCVSIIIHALVILSFNLKPFFSPKKNRPFFEITYNQQIKTVFQQKPRIAQELMPAKEKSTASALPVENPKNIQPFKVKEQPFRADFAKFYKPKESIAFTKPLSTAQMIKVEKIDLGTMSEKEAKEPAYLSYRDLIRKKIQDKVYYYSDYFAYFDNPRDGKVFITFTVLANGALKDLSILDQRSTQDAQLQKIVLSAIKNASPFNKFPEDLKYPERTFNLEISFELQ